MEDLHVKKSSNWNQAATCKADAEEDDVDASVPDEPSIRVNCFALRLFASTTCDVLFYFVFHFFFCFVSLPPPPVMWEAIVRRG